MTASTLGFASFAISLIVVVFWFRAAYNVALPKSRSGYLGILVASAALGVFSLTQNPGWLAGFAASITIVIAVFFVLTVAIGKQKVGEEAIKVGHTLPDFTATDEFGETFDSQNLAGSAVLIKFFRGHW